MAAMTIMSVLSVQAEKTAQLIWTAGNATITFIYDEKVYNEGDSYNGQDIASVYVWKKHDVFWGLDSEVTSSLTKSIIDKSFKDFSPI